MCKLNILPDSSTFPSLLKSVAQSSCVQLGKSIHCNAVQLGFTSDIYTNTALVSMYGVCQQPDDARQLFDESPERNVQDFRNHPTNPTSPCPVLMDGFFDLVISG
ncbi:hypothetical protein CQW23_21274 [Capsicum baccatum]|uniref:Pentatricopeptide repeat-containing protein n=1 Tax=Capsicum baccatum TaxID=33114 RepID=A0A2G2VXL0_CAPBA|nr:hypothetical protein CQW23_21274 [Capsicum baccatum]